MLDVEVKQFDEDFYTFRAEIKELERRLGSVRSQGFEDQPSPQPGPQPLTPALTLPGPGPH